MRPKILIGTPVNNRFVDFFRDYFNCIENLISEKYDIEVCLATEDEEIYNYILRNRNISKVPIYILKFKKEKLKLLNISKGREVIRRFFITKKYDFFLSLDSDISIGREVLERMLKLSKIFDIIVNAYPERNEKLKTLIVSGMGATLISRKVLKEINFEISFYPEEFLFFQKIVKKGIKFISGIFGPTIHAGIKVERSNLNFLEKFKLRIFILFCFLDLVKLYNFIVNKLRIRDLLRL